MMTTYEVSEQKRQLSLKFCGLSLPEHKLPACAAHAMAMDPVPVNA